MIKKLFKLVLIVFGVLVVYLIAMPVPIEPVAWVSPPNPGYQGDFSVNTHLKNIEQFAIGDKTGPEDIASGPDGKIYAATHDGTIIRMSSQDSKVEDWVNTGGRPLGIDFDGNGNLIVADAFQGLLKIDPTGKIDVLTDQADGVPIKYANDIDVAADGKIYFSDASTKFGAKESGGTYEASLLDLMEHGKHGRLLVYDPKTKTTNTLINGLSFANGVAVSHDQSYVLVNETGEYRVIRYWISGDQKGKYSSFGPTFPSFPDNISTGLDGRYWVALVSPRSPLLDKISEKPFVRKIVQRLPASVRPKAIHYGHIVALDDHGTVVADLQDPDAAYPVNTCVTETQDYLYIGSLFMPTLARLSKENLPL